MKTESQTSVCVEDRRGSTLVIVIALLGLLAFTGMIFFSFASQERSAAEYFNEAAKDEVDEPDNVWDHPLSQIISGPGNRPNEIPSILWSGMRRHTLVSNMVGTDTTPFSGEGIHLIMEDDPATAADTTAVPRVDMDWDGTANDEDGTPATQINTQTMLDFVDSPAAWLGTQVRPEAMPAPDVDYTYPDINNIFLAYKGWAIRDNDPTGAGGITPRYERVLIMLPSFVRPQYMKTGGGNGFAGSDTPTDLDWATSFDGVSRISAKFPQRTMRPHPTHITGFQADGTTPVYRYLTSAEAAGLGISSGGFPFVPDDNLAGQPGGLNGILGEMGVWTGSNPSAYELDCDNDGGAGANPALGGDNTREGIWIDTHFPVQEYVDGTGTTRLYVVLHSFTIYDLDGLMNLNVHGNLAGLDRSGHIPTIVASGLLASQSLSRSNLGLGPNEINPVWALRTNLGVAPTINVAAQFTHHFGQTPTNPLEQANMEWLWILTGRAQVVAANVGPLEDLFAGRWGENERLFNSFNPAGGSRMVWDLPRPGRSGNGQQLLSSEPRFGGTFGTDGRGGDDDNRDMLDGEVSVQQGRIRPFGTPSDYAGTGRSHNGIVGTFVETNGTYGSGGTFDVTGGDVRTPILYHDPASPGPERFQRFNGYSVGRDVDTTAVKYIFGQNGIFDNATAASDDLVFNPFLDALVEDPLESIFDPEFAQRDFDRTFGPQDVFALHLPAADLASPVDEISQRLKELSPYALDDANAPFSFNEQTTPGVRGRFTTVSNSLRRFMMKSAFGIDGKPGIAGVDDNNDGTTDNLADLTGSPGYPSTFVCGGVVNGVKDNDSMNRAWEFSADTDGNSTDSSGFPSGDGNLEFPPAYGLTPNTGRPYSSTDPFRPQVRRLLTIESGDSRQLVGQLPLSINHLLDVERNEQTPQEGTVDFLRYMQRAGMRFRSLIDHPAASEGSTVLTVTALPTWTSTTPVPFPPTTPAQREFWARRDRQKLARDIYVLLYTTGGAGVDASVAIDRVRDYKLTNDPAAAVGVAIYTHKQLRRMAQFAVNMVDAMDADNIVTRFEYDKNLGIDGTGTFGGWNMDDDPNAVNAMDSSKGWNEDAPSASTVVTDYGLYPEDGVERGVVYGVEAQELAFSEVLAVTSPDFTPGMYANSNQTAHDDTSGDLNFLHVELQNMRPTIVEMASTVTGTTNEEQAIWQLARYDRPDPELPGTNVVQATVPTQQLTLMEGNASVTGGGKFTIAMAGRPGDPGNTDPTTWQTADLYVNYDDDAGGTFELVSPDVTAAPVTTGTAVTPECDLDLIAATHTGRWLATGNSTSPGLFLDGAPIPNYGGNRAFGFTGPLAIEGFDVALRRRANPNMPQLPLAQNPWVEVDRYRVIFHDMFEPTTDPMTMITLMELHLENAPSHERYEVLNATTSSDYPDDHNGDPDVQAYRFNTIMSTVNCATALTGGNFQLLQQHFDREFASSAELLQLPLVGPNLLTFRMNRMRYSPYQQVYSSPTSVVAPQYIPPGTPASSWLSSAEAMFLQPDFPNLSTAEAGTLSPGTPAVSVNTSLDNRWYRLLQFVEVPSRVHRMLGNYISLQKVPGKLNINMIRHREVLGGLIDNPYLADIPPLLDVDADTMEDAPFMTSADTMPAGRDVWHEMINDRDGLPVTSWNPVTAATANFWLPGTPNAHPFRSFNFLRGDGGGDDGFDETLLRRLRNDLDDDGDGVPNDGPVGYNKDGTPRVQTGGTADSVGTNRHWLEMASAVLHSNPDGQGLGQMPNSTTRHRILSKLVNNTTTVSNTFIVHGTAAYFEAYQDPTTGLIRVGGRFDLDGNGDPLNDQQRAVFIIDRTDAFEAYDPGSQDFDWKRLVKARATIE